MTGRDEAILVIGQLHRGGAEGQLVTLAMGLRESPYLPVVACLSEVSEPHASRLSSAGIEVEIFPRRTRMLDYARLRALGSFLASRRVAVVHSWLVGANAFAYGATRLARVGPFVASSRTSMRMKGPARRIIHGWVFRHADAVIANSEAVRDFTSGYYGVVPSSIHVVPNGVETGPYRECQESSRALRAELGAASGELLVGTVGRLSREKNLPMFVDLAGATSEEFPRARFALAGDGPERESLERKVRRSGLAHRVVFAGSRADVPAFLGALDLFVTTSDTEGLPNAVMEAMAAGLPVVATRVGGTHEVVTEGKTGLLVEPGDSGALARAVATLLRDPLARSAMGSAGRERIESTFGAGRMVEETLRVYETVRAARGRAGGTQG